MQWLRSTQLNSPLVTVDNSLVFSSRYRETTIATQILFAIAFTDNVVAVFFFFLIYRDVGIAERISRRHNCVRARLWSRFLIDFFIGFNRVTQCRAHRHTDLARTHKICIKDIMFHGRNWHGLYNPGDFLAAVVAIAFTTALICKIAFSTRTARLRLVKSPFKVLELRTFRADLAVVITQYTIDFLRIISTALLWTEISRELSSLVSEIAGWRAFCVWLTRQLTKHSYIYLINSFQFYSTYFFLHRSQFIA